MSKSETSEVSGGDVADNKYKIMDGKTLKNAYSIEKKNLNEKSLNCTKKLFKVH